MLETGVIYRIIELQPPLGMRAQFLGYKDVHCQLHGEFMYRGAHFRRIKENGKSSYGFMIDPSKHEIVEDCTC